jgi:hypothetical protein
VIRVNESGARDENGARRRYDFGVESFVPNATIVFGRVGFGFYVCFRVAPSHALRIAYGLSFKPTLKLWNCTRHPVKAPEWMRDRSRWP